MVSEFLPANTTILIEFDCVMSFSKMQLSTITNMNDNIIIKGFGLRTGLKTRTSPRFTIVLGNKYELIRHHSGIYFIQKATEQESMNTLPMGSSDVQRLVEDQKKLKYQLKITRQNNQRLRKTIFELESKIQVWLKFK